MVAGTLRHDTSRNFDPQIHTHCVIANMVWGELRRTGERQASALGREPGAVTAAEWAIAGLEKDGGFHAVRGLDPGRHWTTDAAMARESGTIATGRRSAL